MYPSLLLHIGRTSAYRSISNRHGPRQGAAPTALFACLRRYSQKESRIGMKTMHEGKVHTIVFQRTTVSLVCVVSLT